ncbi:carboxymuconolactone decarboxylase family protein [uncultured Brevundimonas sp.]|uniref:carboxymuconolactone decarboxylase family protein n=1 Tax=uncultured Brevundimonas sp. TaxID=213418 RepID=UPI0030EE811B|tara:strand:+ start:150202 stop:150756 length:555 start_codon:yes stop_codon:yes gene_type:complete
MTDFTLYDETNAPDGSKASLAESKAAFGMIPGLHAVMAESPGLLEAYKRVHELFMASSFDNDELTVVWQTVNVENGCHYCVPAHTGIAKSMGVDDAITNALRDQTPLPNARLEALRDFTLKLIRDRGNVDDASVQAFLDAGFTRQSVFDVILGYSQKVMSNYTNHLARTPVDKPFEKFAWQKAA